MEKCIVGMTSGVPENLVSTQLFKAGLGWKWRLNHTLCEPLGCRSGARTHACYVGGGTVPTGGSRTPLSGTHVQMEPWDQSPKRKSRQGGGSVRLVLIVFSSTTSHRLIFSWCFCALAALWHKPNFTEMEKWSSGNQPRLSVMTDGLERFCVVQVVIEEKANGGESII